MTAPIDFYFDFSSPYGYLASELIEPLAARYGREVCWHPILLGVIFRTTGFGPLPDIPIKGDYAMHDIARSARFHGLPYRRPAPFPIATQQAARGFYWLAQGDARLARRFAAACFRAYFVDGRDIGSPEQVRDIAAALGVDGERFAAAIDTPESRRRLKEATDEAMTRGVFGSPHFIVDGEAFWGVDRLPQLERWLEEGGF